MPGRPIKAICGECHRGRLAGDLERIATVQSHLCPACGFVREAGGAHDCTTDEPEDAR
jgi:hypothetical protein